jgi:hypothetical protein
VLPDCGRKLLRERNMDDEWYDVLGAARMAHEINRAYCGFSGDKSQPTWAGAPEWQRASAIAGVEALIENPDMTPEQSHEGWLELKLAEGWVYGDVKDPAKKTHPCIMEYKFLPRDQQMKDVLFHAAVRTFLNLK